MLRAELCPPEFVFCTLTPKVAVLGQRALKSYFWLNEDTRLRVHGRAPLAPYGKGGSARGAGAGGGPQGRRSPHQGGAHPRCCPRLPDFDSGALRK